MTTVNEKDFIDSLGKHAPLGKAVIKQLGGWGSAKDDFKLLDHLQPSAGFKGFQGFDETFFFYKKNRSKIVKALKEDAGDMGVIQLVSHWEKDKSLDEIGLVLFAGGGKGDIHLHNNLSWFALNFIARHFNESNGGKE